MNTILRGLLGRCPSCGESRLFPRFLKVEDHCSACGVTLHHHRADDFPPYLVMLVVGHLVVPAVLAVETRFDLALWVHAVLWLPLTIGLSLALLQPVKGAVVALQWQLGMHGFGAARNGAHERKPSAAAVGLRRESHRHALRL